MGREEKEGESDRHLKREMGGLFGEPKGDDERNGGDEDDRQACVLRRPMKRAPDPVMCAGEAAAGNLTGNLTGNLSGVQVRKDEVEPRGGQHRGIEPR